MTTQAWSQTDLLHEMTPVVEGELNRHIGVAQEWFPHDYVPWSDGRNFDGLMEGDASSPEASPLSDCARSAPIVNLPTEANPTSHPPEPPRTTAPPPPRTQQPTPRPPTPSHNRFLGWFPLNPEKIK